MEERTSRRHKSESNESPLSSRISTTRSSMDFPLGHHLTTDERREIEGRDEGQMAVS